jgi:hypothetical protein
VATDYIYGYQRNFGAKMKVSEKVNALIESANEDNKRKLLTLKTTTNSGSAFLMAAKKINMFSQILKKAFLLSRTWFKTGTARTWKITVKALKAAINEFAKSLKRLTEFQSLPEFIRKLLEKVINWGSFQMVLI